MSGFPQDIVPDGYPSPDQMGVPVEQIVADASNLWSGTNPTYTLAGFLTRFPQFGGQGIAQAADTTAGSATLTGLASVAGIAQGMFVTGAGIPDQATVVAVDAANLTVTLSLQATATAAQTVLTFYPLLLPLTMLQVYAALADAALQQARYQTSWQIAMDLYLAHFSVLYMQAALGVSVAQGVIEAGRAMGLRTAKSFGDVSTSVDFNAVASDLQGWADFKLTVYGQQLARLGRNAGRGGMLVW